MNNSLLKEAEKDAKRIITARNKAEALINDAMARYVKEKTRAKSKAAAQEKDALLNAAKFAPLKDWESYDDVQSYYGAGGLSESEFDHLTALWEEREALKENIVDGQYSDDVTKILEQAIISIRDYGEDIVERFEMQKHELEDPGDYNSLSVVYPPQTEILAIQNRRLKVGWVNLGEGSWGDYNKNDPKDVIYLRFDVYCRNNPSEEWQVVNNASYCTSMPADTDLKVLQEKTQIIFDKYNLFIDDILNEGSVKKLGEELSWISA